MRTVYKEKERKKKDSPKRSAFWEFMGGDFLLHQKVVRFYPFLLFVFVLVAVVLFNEKVIDNKERKIRQLDEEYKKTVSELKEHNQFIPYDSTKKLIRILESRDFRKDDKNVYKITLKVNHDR